MSRGGGTRAAGNGGEGEIDYYHTRRGEYGVSRTEAPERKASKKYPKPRKGRAASNGGEGNFLEFRVTWATGLCRCRRR